MSPKQDTPTPVTSVTRCDAPLDRHGVEACDALVVGDEPCQVCERREAAEDHRWYLAENGAAA